MYQLLLIVYQLLTGTYNNEGSLIIISPYAPLHKVNSLINDHAPITDRDLISPGPITERDGQIEDIFHKKASLQMCSHQKGFWSISYHTRYFREWLNEQFHGYRFFFVNGIFKNLRKFWKKFEYIEKN